MRTKTQLGDRSFAVARPQVWNMLPALSCLADLGRVKLLSKEVWFSYLLQQNVTWRLPEWSALWSRQIA